MRNRKGFTLAELLIALTVIGIALAVAIPALTSINRKDIETQERIYNDSLITAAKLYNDSYSEDTFGGRKNGCAKIPYSQLEDKDLIRTLESNKLDCDYKDGEEDATGLIVRKINKRYYYETILWCKNKNTGEEEQVSGNIDDKLYEIDEEYCDESASEDNSAPVLHYTNTNPKFYYNSGSYPEPKVWITDSGVGLVNDISVTIDWKDPIGGNTSIDKTFHPGMGNNLSKKPITLPSSVATSDTTGIYEITVKSLNVQDMIGNILETGSLAVPETPDGVSTTKVVSNPEIFYVENTKPTITASANKTWTNQTIPVSLNANDDKGEDVYSGIKTFKYTVKNNSTDETVKTDVDCGTVNTESGITKNNPKNTAQASKSCSFNIGSGDFPGGSYTVTTTAEDWAGNTNTSTNSYEFDNELPSLSITRTAYNKYSWNASDNGHSGLNGYVNNNSSTAPTSGWTTGSTTSGINSVSNAGTYYTWVRDKAGNVKSANISAYTVTRSVGTGTTLTTKFESSGGTSFTNNPVALNGTPIYIEGALQAGYQNLVIKYGSSTISNKTVHNVTGNVTISTSASKCLAGTWNDGTSEKCQSCPDGYVSDAGAKSQNECYINIAAGKYKDNPTGKTTSSCSKGYYVGEHKSYYNASDTCSLCPAGYRDGNGTTAESNCKKSVPAGNRVYSAKGAASSCGKGYFKEAHQVNYGGTSSCTQCPNGYRDGDATDVRGNCKKSVSAGNYVKTANDANATSCGKGYYRASHEVNYGGTSSCKQCPEGYRDANAVASESACKKSVAAGNYVKTAKDKSATACGKGYYKGSHDVSYGGTSSCTQCPEGYRDGNAAGSQSACKKSVSCGHRVSTAKGGAVDCGKGYYSSAHNVNYGSTSSCTSCGSGKTTDSTTSCSSSSCKSAANPIKLCRKGDTCIHCPYLYDDCDYIEGYGYQFPNAYLKNGKFYITSGAYNGCYVYANCIGQTACSAAQCPG